MSSGGRAQPFNSADARRIVDIARRPVRPTKPALKPTLKLQAFARAVYTKKPVPGYHQRIFHGGEAILYTPDDPSKKDVLAFRGTQSLYDAATDVGIVTGRRRVGRWATPYGRRMRRMDGVTQSVLKALRDKGLGKDHLVMTGHSLGGHIAEVMACRYKVRAKVYNKGSFFTKTCPEVTSVRTKGDLISMFGRNQQTVGSYDWNPLHAHSIQRFEGGHWKGFDWIGRQAAAVGHGFEDVVHEVTHPAELVHDIGHVFHNMGTKKFWEDAGHALESASKTVAEIVGPVAEVVIGPEMKIAKMVGKLTGLNPFDYYGNAKKIFNALKDPVGTVKHAPAKLKGAAIDAIVNKVPADPKTKAALAELIKSQAG